jgi:hypothetical protein
VPPGDVDGFSSAMEPHGDLLLRLRQRHKEAVRELFPAEENVPDGTTGNLFE